MIEERWPRIAGLQVQPDGAIGVVWIAQDKDAGVLHVYDAHLFRREMLAVVADGIKRRGRWIPLAWTKPSEDIVQRLLDRGCNTLPEPAVDSDAMAEATSREIEELMRSGAFKVDKRLENWLDELRTFTRQDGQVPRDSHPLMAATRHAVSMLDWARRRQVQRIHGPKLAIV